MPDNPPIPESFRALFDAHAAFVWRVLRRHGVPERELPDACQEVFLVVHRRLGDFEQRSSLQTWIYGIAVRVASSTRRRAHQRRERLDEAVPETSCVPNVAEQLDERTRLSWVEQALGELSEEQREVFALYELEGMTMAQVAELLGVPESTALHRLYAAREVVRAYVMRRERRTRGAPALKGAAR